MTEKEEKAAKTENKADKKENKTDKKAEKADAKAEKKPAKEEAKAADKTDKSKATEGKDGKDAKGKDAKDAKGKDGKEAKGKDAKAAKAKGPKQPTSKMGVFKDKFVSFFKRKKGAKGAKKPKPKKEKPKVPYVDKPDKPERPSQFVHKAVQLDKKDNQFTEKEFQKVRRVSNPKDIVESFRRFGMCLNKADLLTLPKEGLNKVCFMLINDYPKGSEYLGVGPLNDAYLLALIHHKMGYKVVFFRNPEMIRFTQFLEFFLANTTEALTIYYAGRDTSSRVRHIGHGLQFINNEMMSSIEFGKLVGEKSNGNCKILVLSDVGSGRTTFSMKAATSTENVHCSPIVSFSIDKQLLKPKERRRSQGLFTYYFCKLVRQFPNCTPNQLVEMLNISLERFKETFSAQLSIDELGEQPVFVGADVAFNGPSAGNGPQAPGGAPPQPVPAAAPPKPATEAIPAEAK